MTTVRDQGKKVVVTGMNGRKLMQEIFKRCSLQGVNKWKELNAQVSVMGKWVEGSATN